MTESKHQVVWFDIPVLAYRAAAVPETLGEAGVLFTEKRLPELAALAHLLVEDQALRARVVATQKARRRTYLPEFVLPAFVDLLEKLTGGAQHARAAS